MQLGLSRRRLAADGAAGLTDAVASRLSDNFKLLKEIDGPSF